MASTYSSTVSVASKAASDTCCSAASKSASFCVLITSACLWSSCDCRIACRSGLSPSAMAVVTGGGGGGATNDSVNLCCP